MSRHTRAAIEHAKAALAQGLLQRTSHALSASRAHLPLAFGSWLFATALPWSAVQVGNEPEPPLFRVPSMAYSKAGDKPLRPSNTTPAS